MVYAQIKKKYKKTRHTFLFPRNASCFSYFFFYEWLFFIRAVQNTLECLPGWHIFAPKSFQTLGEQLSIENLPVLRCSSHPQTLSSFLLCKPSLALSTQTSLDRLLGSCPLCFWEVGCQSCSARLKRDIYCCILLMELIPCTSTSSYTLGCCGSTKHLSTEKEPSWGRTGVMSYPSPA